MTKIMTTKIELTIVGPVNENEIQKLVNLTPSGQENVATGIAELVHHEMRWPDFVKVSGKFKDRYIEVVQEEKE